MREIRINHLVRNIEAGEHVENFLISAVTSILAIRTFLITTNYIQIKGGIFHISHMLWGGFFMMVALITLLVFLNREIKVFAATLGGLGFGAFIDELGKFITKDYNYFFQPTIAFIYVIFVLIFLFSKAIDQYLKTSDKEYAINALEMVKEAMLHNLDLEEKKRALELIKKSNPRDPMVKLLKRMLTQIDALPSKRRNLLTKIRKNLRHYYRELIKNPWFAKTVIAFFVIASATNLFQAALKLTVASSFANWGNFLASGASTLFVLLGVYYIQRKKRMSAYEAFKFAVLISIFLIQFFKFFQEQLSAVTRLGISIIIWNVLQNLIHQEALIAKANNSQ